MKASTNHRVLLVGATGMLGRAIVKAILERPDIILRVLMRPGKPEADTGLRARGVEIAEGDVLNPSSLPAAMEGIDVVVSALHNDPKVFLAGHENLVETAERSGVGRLVPSDFSVDFLKIEADENFNLAMRNQVAGLFDGRRLRPVHVLSGAFMDTMLDPRTRRPPGCCAWRAMCSRCLGLPGPWRGGRVGGWRRSAKGVSRTWPCSSPRKSGRRQPHWTT
jgi:hypothetical protein